MSTPEAKLQLQRASNCSKYLTPCRTFGLKRKSTSPRTPCSKVMCRTEDILSPLSSATGTIKVPLKNIENTLSEISSDHDVLYKEGEIKKGELPKKKTVRVTNKGIPIPVEETHVNINEAKEIIPDSKLLKIIDSINSKIEKVDNLKRNAVYTKKHNIIELRKTTDKWKKTCREVILEIHKAMKSRGHDVSVSSILDQHNIPHDYVGFNSETMDFE